MKVHDKREHHFENINFRELRIAIITARFNCEITEQLRASALKAFQDLGGEESQIDCFWVPGSFELPLTAKKVALTQKYDAVICLGALIKGETAHFEYISASTLQGISQVALETGFPIICGVLTTYTLEQAKERSGTLNLGKSYLGAALEMIETLKTIETQVYS